MAAREITAELPISQQDRRRRPRCYMRDRYIT